MKENYNQMHKRHQDETNSLPFACAFTSEDLREALKTLGVSSTSEIFMLMSGVFARKSDRPRIDETFERHERELKEAMKDFDFCKSAFRARLDDHEYCITMDPTEAMNDLGVTQADLDANPVLAKALNAARDESMQWALDHDAF